MMNRPPPILDGAQVLWWAWAGDIPFFQHGPDEIFGFAVCQYESGQLYRFTCTKDWEVVNDADCGYNEAAAKRSIPANCDASRVRWTRYGSGE